ncbi:uncharacterized protein TRIVIDRAFT_49485 [Trichoderma virens Gv29-8]|uniref:F-box domain-containing protein n=1 Tax=Hypocrea virens (strain Gv29-8 / FGSC 10586) TaxID=413071 RepID=G9N276_HYPVG|nr:uncharacterized protein TRIVIDRAFT_49485 [Trichoderma virens Gv29-8]EHK19190.1 hypothetical protein TRIVIDRAFT_49485 [Trichoderma virens Gv29-8]UKZ49355.1 hypothetical protein TrVGV298_003602 [Trichoderma virens]
MSRWSRLPEEMRLQVLETLAQDPLHGTYDLTNYALVCKSWQSIFERANFRRLVLCQADLDGLAKIPKRCRPYVRHICLRIEMQQYRPWAGPVLVIRPERMEDIATNNDIIELAIGNLFRVLKSWEKELQRAQPSYRGITLEMSMHSPSDPKYVYRGVTATGLEKGLSWESEAGHEGAVARVFGGSIHIRFYENLPQLNLVTRFIMKRHTRRRVSSFTLHQILSKLPHLQDLVYEPWQQSLDTVQDLVDAGYVNLIKGSLPKGLKHVTLLEDHPYGQAGLSVPSDSAQNASARTSNPFVGAALAKRSVNFESLSASFLVEANDFFRAYKREWTWAALRSLTLTSRYLDSKRSSDEINGMLKAAGDAALAMPVLRTMEIWNGGPGYAAVFEYHAEHGEAYIAWHSTWDLVIDAHVIKAWEFVGYKNHGCRIGVHDEHTLIGTGDEFRHYQDVIQRLRTRKNVISRQSLDELRLEVQDGCMCCP